MKKNLRKKSYLKLVKQIGLNIGKHSRVFKLKKGKWGMLNGISYGRSKPLNRKTSKWVRYGLHFINKNSVRLNKTYKFRLLNKQRLKLVYGGMKDKTIKKLYRRSKYTQFKKDHLLILLESRLDTMLFRTGFPLSIRQSRKWISSGYISVNGEMCKHHGKELVPTDIIQISKKAWLSVYAQLIERAKDRKVRRPASWLIVDYRSLSALYTQKMELKDLVFTHMVETQSATNMYSVAKSSR